jgi:hypothetical protein
MEDQNSSIPTNDRLEQIKSGARILFNPKQLVEVRAMGTNGHWRGFYFDDHERMAQVVEQLDQDDRVQSLYYVFNLVDPKLVESRQTCQCDKCVRGGLIVKNPTSDEVEKIITGPSQHLTQNEEVRTIRWLFIDVDTIRATGHEHDPSTREEKAACKEVTKKVLSYLKDKGWPSALLGNSGNGYHILLRIEQPNTPATIMYVEDCLKALSAKFTCEAADIDCSVFNPNRLTRAYGTHTRKGIETEDRPYRPNGLYKPEASLRVVSLDQMIALADEAPQTSKSLRGDMPLLHENFDPGDFFQWFEDQGAFEVTGTSDWQGHEVKIIDHCIISGTKHTGSKLTGFIIGDSFGYHCWSPECNDPKIGDVLAALKEQGYKPYPKKIWEEEDVTNFAEDVTHLEQLMESEKQTFEKKPEPELESEIEEAPLEDNTIFEEMKAASLAEEGKEAPALPPPEYQPKGERLVGKPAIELATYLLGVIFRDPEKVYSSYVMYRKRLENIASHLKAPVGETLGLLWWFEQDRHTLPTRMELKDYINNGPRWHKRKDKQDNCNFIDSLVDDPTRTFDTTIEALIEEVDWRNEKKAWLKAYDLLTSEERDIQGARTLLRKYWATTIGLDSDFQPGTWQENTDMILEAFRRDVAGEDDARKFKMGFDSIDNSGMNIGLDGMRAIVIYGPAANRKTTLALTLALNFAMQGKRGLFLAGEHGRLKIEKSLTVMFSHYLRKSDTNPEGLDVIPGLNKWEGLNKTATWEDFDNINKVLTELRTMRLVPGYLEVQNIQALTRGEEDAVGAIMSYVDATHKKYEWDFIIIDPLDSILPNEGGEDKNHYQACCAVVDRLFDYSRGFNGDRGLMVVVTAQFKAEARRAIEKIQQKNTGNDDFDDEIEAMLHQDSQIQYIGNKLTQRFDLALGVACRIKNGLDGMIVQGRCREAGFFDVLYFGVDPDSNLIFEKVGGIIHRVANDTNQVTSAEVTISNYDVL